MSTPKMGFYRSRILPHLMNAVMSTDENREIRSRVCADLAGRSWRSGSVRVSTSPTTHRKFTRSMPSSQPPDLVALASERIESGPRSGSPRRPHR